MKVCKFCGKDISTLRSHAIICNNPKCKALYDAERKRIREQNKDRFCEICGKLINDLPGQRKICLDENCIKEQKRRKYNSSKKERTCKYCGNVFIGTLKQNVCENCKKLPKTKEQNKIQQKIYCKRCGKFIKYEEKILTARTKLEKYQGYCSECKESAIKSHKMDISKRMKENNPMYNSETVKKSKETKIKNNTSNSLGHKQTKEEKQKRKNPTKKIKRQLSESAKVKLSNRMKINNPMKNEISKNKMKRTLEIKRLNNEIFYKKGKEHHLWKGNRNFNMTVRSRLKSWIQKEFSEKNFVCEICGKRGSLHVHHIQPLRDIINKFLLKNNITIDELEKNKGDKTYNNIIDQIVNYHYNNKIGMVVCPNCHNKIDPYYHKKKKHENSKKRSKKRGT